MRVVAKSCLPYPKLVIVCNHSFFYGFLFTKNIIITVILFPESNSCGGCVRLFLRHIIQCLLTVDHWKVQTLELI